MGAARICLEDLVYAMEADETARIVSQHGLRGQQKPSRHVFTVTVMSGQNIMGRGHKPADGFVSVTDKETGERLFKSRTILGAEDPRWEQSFELSVGAFKALELSCSDRQLVGKHDIVGTATFKLDPRAYIDTPIKDIVLPLLPRGMVNLRISMEGGERHDVEFHLTTAGRALDRAAGDMTREIVDRMADFIKSHLCASTLAALVKTKDKKIRKAATEQEIENSLMPIFEYFNENFSVFSVTLTHDTRIATMLSIWRRLIDILISLLVPPLSDKPSTKDQLSPQEVDIVFKWLQQIKAFFNASENGVEHGVPLTALQSGHYKDIVLLGQYLDLPTPTLKDRCSAAVKSASRQKDEERIAEVLLRVVRTRPDTGEFLGLQIGILNRARMEKQA